MGNGLVIGINGYGRIGRAFHRQALDDPMIRVAAINSRSDAGVMAQLLQYDSVYGRLDADIETSETGFSVNGQHVAVCREPTPESIPWALHGVDIVIEATGKFKDRSSAGPHLSGGAAGVILCCPPKDDAVPSVVFGVNERTAALDRTPVVSNASCTTNALAPLLRILDERFGIDFCSFRTIHAVTDSQHLLDNASDDPRRARAAMESIIPTSTGASSMIRQLFPHLEGKVHGLAYRVPTRSVSNIDLTVKLNRPTTAREVNTRFMDAAEGAFRGIVGVSDAPLVSIDFKADPRSVIVDLDLTTDCGGGYFNLSGWYDNEWGYSARLIDLARYLMQNRVPQTAPGPMLSDNPREDGLCAMSATASA